MFHSKHFFTRIVILGVILISGVTFATQYHQPDLFPIGFSGFSNVGYTEWDPIDSLKNFDGSPYYDAADYGIWAWEDTLLRRTHCNFIGCSDAWYNSYIAFTSPDKKDFYNKVCIPALAGGDTIYVGVNGVNCPRYLDANGDGDTTDTGDVNNPNPNPIRWSSIFRSYGPPSFSACTSCPGDEFWQAMTKEGAECYDNYFDSTQVNTHCFWGYNPFVENPAIFRGGLGSDRSLRRSGVYAADDSIAAWIRARETSGSDGLRGPHRMIIGKHQLYPLMQQESGVEVNLFEEVPEIDAVLIYTIMWDPWTPYGRQSHFDRMIYGVYDNNPKSGFHNAATYMQKYGNWNLQDNQDRRWMAGIEINWEFTWEGNTEKILSRRPCPPEIRAMTYLALSRGAKGIVYVNYYNNRWRNDTIPNAFPTDSNFPAVESGYSGSHTARTGCLGLRDYTSQPCDENYSGGTPMLLDVDDGQTTYWDGKPDHTFGYLCELIPEIRAITSTLVHLDWVNAYSLKSTASQWEKPGSHMYISWIVPWGDNMGDGYIDLAFFDDPDDIASEYFMVVNRDGIAQMDTSTLQIALDGSRWSNNYGGINRLIVKNMADTTDTFVLTPSNGYIFTDIFAPGEGKLYRVRGGGGGCVPIKLHLWGDWRESRAGPGYMDPFAVDTSLGWAALNCRWHKDKPATLERNIFYGKICDASAWTPFDTFWAEYDLFGNCYPMQDSCMRFVAVGEHPDGDTLDSIADGLYGTESNKVQIVHPGSIYPGCPDLYSFFYQDTSVSPGHVFAENNTILPHSQHYQAIDEDLLKLDVLNTEPDHYYLSIMENDDEISYLDQVKLWVVDHDADEQVATSADDSIYVYSDMVGPASCTDQGNNDKLDQILWEDTVSFAGPANSYLTIKFSDPGWTYAGLLMSMGDPDKEDAREKDYLSIPSEPDGGGTWDSLGVAYGRMNPSQWLVDVSDCDSFTFRVYCGGSDTCFIDRIALVKLEPSGWSLTEAVLDSAVHYYPNGTNFSVGALLIGLDTLGDTLKPDHQVSFRFDKVDTSTTYSVRDFVFQSRGYYYSPLLQKSGIEEGPLEFGLEVQQIAPLSRAAFISYSVPYAINVKIGVYDVAGRLVKSIVNEKVKPGKYCEEWQGKDNAGRTLASGVYFVKMMTEDFEKTDKIVILE